MGRAPRSRPSVTAGHCPVVGVKRWEQGPHLSITWGGCQTPLRPGPPCSKDLHLLGPALEFLKSPWEKDLFKRTKLPPPPGPGNLGAKTKSYPSLYSQHPAHPKGWVC